MVNGVYAIGFLYMLPQLLINYNLKSVAALPWHTLIYKSLNMVNHYAFAFIVTMPTPHLLAYFSGDIVFIIHLYQRWLYPVDKSRLDHGNVVRTTDANATDESDELIKSSKPNTN